ncbi:unnamed protein product, partial [Heterosigma akashiwo]
PPSQAVVFSQWTYMLDLVEVLLRRMGWRHTRLDGSMSQQQREDALERFATETDIPVMLLSLKAGGVGLNLT